jgi:hypothetical protein
MDEQGAFASITTVATPLGNNSGYNVAGAVGSSAAALTDWQKATQAIVTTMTDLRSTLLGTGNDSYAKLQAQFAIEIAQAKAGDLSAMQDLPTLAKSLATAGQAQAGSSTESALIVARIIDSLGGVAGIKSAGGMLSVPSFDVGTNLVPRDMFAMLHAGESVTPKEYNPAYSGNKLGSGNGSGADDVVAELGALRSDVNRLLDRIADSTEGTNGTLKKATRGNYLATTAA